MDKQKTSYKFYEDNGGGLHLFVFSKNGDVKDGITNLEYAKPGEYESVKDNLNKRPISEVKTWDGHMTDNNIDPEDLYFGFANNPHAADLVCDNGILYPEKMGAAGQVYFGATIEINARKRIGEMNFYKSQIDFCFEDWSDWFDHMVWLLSATKQEIIDWIDSNK